MNYTEELLEKIFECGKRLLTPQETAFYLGVDEMALVDDINTKGTIVRTFYVRGVMETVAAMRKDVIDTAKAGSPFAMAQVEMYLRRAINESNL